MNTFNFEQWILIFFLFSFFGWIFESSYVSLHEKHPVNRGFCVGPWIPLYGCGAVLMMFIALPFAKHAALVFLIGMAGATALEYVTGFLMEKLFRIRYWDYTGKLLASKNGYISLPSSLCWGAFTLILTYAAAPWIEQWIYDIPYRLLKYVTFFLSLIFAVDVAESFRTALRIRSLAEMYDSIQTELSELRAQLEESFPALADAIEAGKFNAAAGRELLRYRKEQFEKRVDANIAFHFGEQYEKLAELFEGISLEEFEKLYDHAEEFHDHNIEACFRHYEVFKAKREAILARLNWQVRNAIKGNPDITSKIDGFAAMKEVAKRRMRNRLAAASDKKKQRKDRL